MTSVDRWFEKKLQGSQLISPRETYPLPTEYKYHGYTLAIHSSHECPHILHVTTTNRQDCLTWSVSLTVNLINTLFQLLDSEVPNGKHLVLCVMEYDARPPLPLVCHAVAEELRTHPSLRGHFYFEQDSLLVYKQITHLHKIQHVAERFEGPCFHECDTMIHLSDGLKEGVTERRRVEFFCDDLNWYILLVSDPITFTNIYDDMYVRFPELEKAIPALKRASRLTRCEYAVHPRLNKLHWYIDNWNPQQEPTSNISNAEVGAGIPTTYFLHWLAVRREPTGAQQRGTVTSGAARGVRGTACPPEEDYIRAVCSSIHAACNIQKRFRRAIVDPAYPICRSRLLHELEDLSETLTV